MLEAYAKETFLKAEEEIAEEEEKMNKKDVP